MTGKILLKGVLIRGSLLLMLLGCSVSSVMAAEVIRQRLGFSPGMREYETELIRLALRSALDSQKDYRLTSVYLESSIDRILTELNSGEAMHVTINTFAADKNRYPRVASFELPDSRNLLGFRQFIVRSEDRERFQSVNTAEDFFKLKPGQVAEWSEVDMYKQAGFQLILSRTYGQLFPMLTRKRFDYLPLGLLEIEEAFGLEKDRHPALTTVDGIYIYYPLKLFVHYHQGDASRVSMIGKGLETIFNNGEEEALFNAQFGNKFKTVDRESARIFILENPAYSREENRRISEHFIKHHHFDDNAVWLNTPPNTTP